MRFASARRLAKGSPPQENARRVGREASREGFLRKPYLASAIFPRSTFRKRSSFPFCWVSRMDRGVERCVRRLQHARPGGADDLLGCFIYSLPFAGHVNVVRSRHATDFWRENLEPTRP